jgi:hypothetical protein
MEQEDFETYGVNENELLVLIVFKTTIKVRGDSLENEVNDK